MADRCFLERGTVCCPHGIGRIVWVLCLSPSFTFLLSPQSVDKLFDYSGATYVRKQALKMAH